MTWDNIIKFNKYNIIKTDSEFDKMLSQIKNSDFISIDTENDGLIPTCANPAGFSFCVNENIGFYIPINHTDIKTNLFLRFNEIIKTKKEIIFHNSPYDCAIIKKHYLLNNDIIEDKNWFDTMIAAHLIDERQSKGLKNLSLKYLNYKQSTFKETVKDKSSTQISSIDIYKYAIDDVFCTLRLYKIFKQQLKEQKLEKLFYEIEMPFQKVLTHIKNNGFLFDIKKNKEIEERLNIDNTKIKYEMLKFISFNEIQKTLCGDSINTFNFNSSQQLSKLLFEKLKLPIKEYTDGGSPSCNDKALLKMRDEKDNWLHPIVPLLIQYKKNSKIISSFTHSLRDKVINETIYSDLLDHGTKSGRLSCINPNLQQIASNDNEEEHKQFLESCEKIKYKDFFKSLSFNNNVRECFKSRPNYKLFVADFSQEELRLTGILCKSKKLKDAFIRGDDLHLSVANDSFNLNIPLEYLNKKHKNYNYYKNKYSSFRKKAKFINFGVIYGIGSYGLSQLTKSTEEEAEQVLNNYFEKFTKIKSHINITKTWVKYRGYVTNMFGRRRRFEKNEHGYYNGGCYRQAFNFLIQSAAADILRIVMNKCYEYIKTTNNEIKILSTVHDEIIFEIKENDNFNVHKNKIVDIMENTVELEIPLKVDSEVGDNYGECK